MIALLKKNDFYIHALFIALGALSLIFAQERLFADASYYFFKVVNYSSFWVEHDRFILIFSQWLPLFGEKMGLSLNTLILLCSIGHVLFFYFAFILCRYGFKDNEAGWVLLYIQVIAVTQGYFVPMFELYYGVALLVVFNAINNKHCGPIAFVVLLFLAFFILTAYMYTFILLFFTLIIHEKKITRGLLKKVSPYILLMAAILYYKSLNSSEYESGIINQFHYSIKNKELNLSYFTSLISFLTAAHWKGFFLFLITVALLIIKKNFKLLIIFIFFFFGILLIATNLSSSFSPSRYNEQVYFPLWFLVIFTLIKGVLAGQNSPLKISLLSLGSVVGIISIINISFFSDRLKEMHVLMEEAYEMEGDKFFILAKDLKYDANWSYPIETLLFSSVKNKGQSITLCTDDDLYFNDNLEKVQPQEFIFRRWDIKSIDELNKKYFNLSEGDYKKIISRN